MADDPDNTQSQQDYFRERLPPAPGQYGYKPTDTEDRVQNPQEKIPYGFLRMAQGTNPYIMTSQNPALRDRPHNDWGTPDYVLQGMLGYPEGETPQGNFVPGEADMGPMVHNMTMEFGRFAAPGIGMPMINAGRSWLAGTQAYQKGAMQAAAVNRENAILQMKIADYRLSQLLRRYSSAFADYGPGKDQAGSDYNADKFTDAIRAIATEFHDTTVLNMLDNQDLGALERHLKHLDGTGQDLKKTLQMLNIENAKERNKWLKDRNDAAEKKKQDDETAIAPFRTPNPIGGTPAPHAPTGPGTDSDVPTSKDPGDTNFDINTLSPPEQKGDQPDTEPEEHAPVPSSDDQSSIEQPDQQKPIQTAQADTGVASDAPAPGDQERAARSWDEEAKKRDAAGDKAGADDARDWAKRWRDGTWYEKGRAKAGAPIAGKPAAEQLPAVNVPQPAPSYHMQPSAVFEAAHKRGLLNDQMIEGYAIRYSNHTLTKEEAKGLPKIIQTLVGERAQELDAEYTRLADSGLKGEALLTELAKINKPFAATMRAYVAGRAPPPVSAWQNAAYRDRVLALGTAIDPKFNYATFGNRLKMYNSYAHGPNARQMTAFKTLDIHASNMVEHMHELEKLHPGLLKRYFGAAWAAEGTRVALTKAEADVIGKLDTDAQGVRDEYAKALGGGQPHAAAQAEAAAILNFRWDRPDIIVDRLQNMRHQVHQKMGVLVHQYNAVMGPQQDDLGILYNSYVAAGDNDPTASPINPETTAGVQQWIREFTPPKPPPMPTYRQVP
jgi:hypothetical protein